MLKWLGRNRAAISLFLVLLIFTFILGLRGLLLPVAGYLSESNSLLSFLGVLLAVTFTSYSLLFIGIPYIKKMTLESNAVGSIGNLFLFTIYCEMSAIILDFIVQMEFTKNFAYESSLMVIVFYLSALAFLLIGLLSYYVHLLFEKARKGIGK